MKSAAKAALLVIQDMPLFWAFPLAVAYHKLV